MLTKKLISGRKKYQYQKTMNGATKKNQGEGRGKRREVYAN